MVQTAENGAALNRAAFRGLDFARFGTVFFEGEMGPVAIVIINVLSKDLSGVPFPEDNDVVETVATHRSDHALGECVLLGCTRRAE